MQEFQTALDGAGSKLVVIDAYAHWCGPCRMIAPFVEQLSEEYAGRAVFLKINVDEARDVAQHLQIRAMPTFTFYKNGQQVEQFSGASPERLRSTVDKNAGPAAAPFAGEGFTLGSAPKIDWGSVSGGAADPKKAAAVAAAARLGVPLTNEKKEPVAQIGAPALAAPVSAPASAPASAPVPEEPPAAVDDAAAPMDAEPAVAVTAEDVPNSNLPGLPPVDEQKRAMLEEMGFSRIRAEKALILTSNGSVEQAADWIFVHMEDPDIDEPLQVVAAPSSTMSEEERRQKANELLLAARAKRAEEEKQRELEREKNRIKSGKEITTAKSKYDEEQRRRDIALKKKEKMDQIKERERLRELLEADRQARDRKFHKHDGAEPVQEQQVIKVDVPGAADIKAGHSSVAGKINIRFPDGSKLEDEFSHGQTLEDVAVYVQSKRPDLVNFYFQTTYPRKTYRPAEFKSAELSAVGLLPRGALLVVFP